MKPMTAGSARLEDVDEPPESDGPVLVETLAIGVCGTDAEIVSGAYGWAPPGRDRLVLGHESLGRVLEAPAGSGVAPGDLVVGIVRRPDPVPCTNCAAGEWDFCRNGQYTERGIKSHDGYCSERYRITPEFVVKVDPALGQLGVLLEPTSVVAKAWDQIDKIGGRATWDPRHVVVTGAGPIGLLAALLAVQRGLEVHVFDQVTTGPSPTSCGPWAPATTPGPIEDACDQPDVVIECTGVGSLVFDAMEHLGPGGVACLTGVSSGGPPPGCGRRHAQPVRWCSRTSRSSARSTPTGATTNRAPRRCRRRTLRGWRALTRRVPLDHFDDALDPPARRRQGGDRGGIVTAPSRGAEELAPGGEHRLWP